MLHHLMVEPQKHSPSDTVFASRVSAYHIFAHQHATRRSTTKSCSFSLRSKFNPGFSLTPSPRVTSFPFPFPFLGITSLTSVATNLPSPSLHSPALHFNTTLSLNLHSQYFVANP